MTVSTRVAIVEDHTLLAQSLGFALRAEGLSVAIGDLTDESTLLRTVAADAATLVLLDLDLGEPLVDGVHLVPLLREAGARVLVVTGTLDDLRIASALEHGAVGYLRKHKPFEELLTAVVRAAAGERVIDEAERLELLASLRRDRVAQRQRLARFEGLTPKERDVLRELMAGKSVDAIAADWFVSEATVRTQVRGVLTKLDVRSQLAAVAAARTAGWEPGEAISASRRPAV